VNVIDSRFGRFDETQRAALLATAGIIRSALPGASEVMSYGMPTFKVGGDTGVAVIGLEGFKAHNSLFPYSTSIAREFEAELAPYAQTKGSIHFAIDRPFPAPLLKRILKARIREINESYPRRSGETREYYDNGFPKSAGRVRSGELHGAWTWFRRDGSLMRSGSFRNGEQVGEWVTYDRGGEPVKVTSFG
jgi:uncharacterized protein YdhG (YjbR/CyaY superfamily)